MPTMQGGGIRKQLIQADEELAEWQSKVFELLEHVDDQDVEHLERFADTMKDWALKASSRVPPSVPAPAVAELRGLIIDGMADLDGADWSEPLELLDRLLVRIEAARHVLRDELDEDLGVDESDARALVQVVDACLPGVALKDVAELLGVTPRSVQRWRRTGGTAPPRLRLVARLVHLLSRAWTPEGVAHWFLRRRPDLGGVPPMELLDEPLRAEDLLAAARQGRAGHGA